MEEIDYSNSDSMSYRNRVRGGGGGCEGETRRKLFIVMSPRTGMREGAKEPSLID